MISTKSFGKLSTVFSSAKVLFVGKLKYCVKIIKNGILYPDRNILQKDTNINLHTLKNYTTYCNFLILLSYFLFPNEYHLNRNQI